MRTRLAPTTPFLDIVTKAGLVFAGHPTGLGRSRARKYLEKPLLQLRIKKDDGSERVKVPLQRELNADEAILPEVNNVLERLRLDFDLFEPLRKMLELDVNFFALRGMPENTEYLYLHL